MGIDCQDRAACGRCTPVTSFGQHLYRNFMRNRGSNAHVVPSDTPISYQAAVQPPQAGSLRPGLSTIPDVDQPSLYARNRAARSIAWIPYWWFGDWYYLGRPRASSFDAANPSARPTAVNASRGQKINTSGPASCASPYLLRLAGNRDHSPTPALPGWPPRQAAI